MEIVRIELAYDDLKPVIENDEYMESHRHLRRKSFLPVRPRDACLEPLAAPGFQLIDQTCRSIVARVDEWNDFLFVFHECVRGWVGGAEKVMGRPASAEAIERRQALIRAAMNRLFDGAETFDANWTYLWARRPD